MKNIVICCDGTGNEISENISNVLKIYRVIRKTNKTEPYQAVFYHPGVGTLAQPDPWRKFWQDAKINFALATGYGLDSGILAAYQFLVEQYEDGDEIFLFGFSRGAYTVRALAGLVHKIGLVSKNQLNLSPTGLTAYKQTISSTFDAIQSVVQEAGAEDVLEDEFSAPLSQDDRATQFARILSVRWPTIKFVGVWDTVASVIVPRPDRFYFPSLQKLAFTQENPSVRVFRQAIAIDERRRMFRLDPWSTNQVFRSNRFSRTKSESQDSKQVWFSGVHADIGGGYREEESQLSKFPLLWMLNEAIQAGLAVDKRTVNQLVLGKQRLNSPFKYVAPDVGGIVHNSMGFWWRLLEYLPKANHYKEWHHRRSSFGFYLPLGEPRPIEENALVHESVIKRLSAVPSYSPINLPRKYDVVPMLELSI
ncbi:MAG: DUF2235 domain-containing protein [Xanthobacteraceae bacterium]|jgi:uncharacterized protein (DUF2235 family)|nr:DUF2235 domain-containing protein [Xanthobacteraceae bacterium]MBX3519581.1 DUF2235 domain-containing protein [Xanthobacteraceae bacterium]MBX3549251.1 DUF2235 domain-containing protein [Xanthobacteraceae bacterium]